MSVPTPSMEMFIKFVEGNTENIEQVDLEALNLKKGEKVMVTSGPFKGKIATFARVKGKRSKQIVAVIDGYVAVMATSEFTVEKIS